MQHKEWLQFFCGNGQKILNMETFELLQCYPGCKGLISILTIMLSVPLGLLYMAGSMLVYWTVIEFMLWRIKRALDNKGSDIEEINQSET